MNQDLKSDHLKKKKKKNEIEKFPCQMQVY